MVLLDQVPFVGDENDAGTRVPGLLHHLEILHMDRLRRVDQDQAHVNGVVHRDIKPGNILLSAQGEPLVADFGIALAVAQAGAGRITETGLSLGTPHYMSPEQATGDRDVDPRSDVYALGCVLYEMLAGQPPFSASTAQAVLVKILTADAPSITSERRTVPPNVGAALAQALEKLPADRFTSAAEFAAALADEGFMNRARARTSAATTPSETIVPVVTARPWHRDGRFVASVLVGATMTALAAWGWLSRPPAPEPGVPTRAAVTGVDMTAGTGWRLAISPDGSSILKVVDGSIHIRAANDPEWRQLPNTGGGGGVAARPFRRTGYRSPSPPRAAGSRRYRQAEDRPFRSRLPALIHTGALTTPSSTTSEVLSTASGRDPVRIPRDG